MILLIVVGGGALPCKFMTGLITKNYSLGRERNGKLIRHCIEQGNLIIATCRGMQYM